MIEQPKIYLGDSVYATFTGYSIVLTTENGLPEDPSNVIHLEQNEIRSLVDFVKKVGLR